jgi:hypothetical protein
MDADVMSDAATESGPLISPAETERAGLTGGAVVAAESLRQFCFGTPLLYWGFLEI